MMYLRPITPPPIDVGRFDRSGLWINSGPDGYVVTDVAANGPAEQAGIQVGDIITQLDGAPSRFDGLSDARILLRPDRPGPHRTRGQTRKRGAENDRGSPGPDLIPSGGRRHASWCTVAPCCGALLLP